MQPSELSPLKLSQMEEFYTKTMCHAVEDFSTPEEVREFWETTLEHPTTLWETQRGVLTQLESRRQVLKSLWGSRCWGARTTLSRLLFDEKTQFDKFTELENTFASMPEIQQPDADERTRLAAVLQSRDDHSTGDDTAEEVYSRVMRCLNKSNVWIAEMRRTLDEVERHIDDCRSDIPSKLEAKSKKRWPIFGSFSKSGSSSKPGSSSGPGRGLFGRLHK